MDRKGQQQNPKINNNKKGEIKISSLPVTHEQLFPIEVTSTSVKIPRRSILSFCFIHLFIPSKNHQETANHPGVGTILVTTSKYRCAITPQMRPTSPASSFVETAASSSASASGLTTDVFLGTALEGTMPPHALIWMLCRRSTSTICCTSAHEKQKETVQRSPHSPPRPSCG